MQQSESGLKLVLFAGTLLMLVVFVFIIMFVILYERKRLNHKMVLHKLDMDNQRKLLDAIITTQENEKQQFAAELHDSISQMLTSMLMHINAIDARLKSGGIDEKYLIGQLQLMREVNKQSIAETRNISRKLHPIVLNDFGLFDAITDLCSKTNELGKVAVHYSYESSEKRLLQEVERALYRVSQELINNTIKYADAQNINITIVNKLNQIQYKYTDDGSGFNIGEKIGKGLGLLSMQSRISAINGTIKLSSEPDKGLQVIITVPLT
jgi:signal transduction histidine kinase